MKNILFASTALVATAGVASADIALSGWAEIGVVGGSDAETVFHTDIDVSFSMTGESDNGLTFGATVDLDENGAFATDTDGGASYFVAFSNARLDIGDTDGAFDAALQEVNLVGGSINDAETGHAGFSGNGGVGDFATSGDIADLEGMGLDGAHGGNVARFTYTASGFSGFASVELNQDGDDDQAIYAVGVAYDTDLGGTALGVGLGYQSGEIDGTKVNVIGVSVDATLASGFSAALNYSKADIDGAPDDVTHMAVGLGYTMNNIGLGVNYGEYKFDGEKAKGFGVAATYDFGGGLEAQFGYGNSDDSTAADSTNTWSLGLAMSF